MAPIHHNSLLFFLHLLRPHLQHPHQTTLLHPLRLDRHHLPFLDLLLLLRQPPPGTRQPRRRQIRPAQHKSYRTSIYPDLLEAVGERVHDFQVRHDRVVHVLPEERGGVEDVEGDAVGEFHEVKLGLLRDDFVDVWFEAGVGFEDFGADGALDGRFYFGFCACI
jgi:hypothetical protein